jgi:hypothetical protein
VAVNIITLFYFSFIIETSDMTDYIASLEQKHKKHNDGTFECAFILMNTNRKLTT